MGRCVCCLVVLGVVGVIAIVTGLVLILSPYLRNFIHDKVEEDIALVNGSASFNAWVDPPAPVYIEFRLFSIVNPQEVLKNGTKPVVKEMGPYVYREIRAKKNITFLENGTQISYVQPKSYVYVPEKSKGSPNDNVTHLNFPILAAAYMFQYSNILVQTAVKDILKFYNEHLFETHTAHEILWGYEEPTFKALAKYLPKSYNIPTVVGMFTGPTANGTNDGEYKICSGSKDAAKLAQILTWDGNSSVSYWNDTYGNMINGTDGSLWHPFVDRSEKLYIFSSDVCRSIYATYNRTVELEGITMYRYTVPRAVLASAKENPDNKAFCTPDCLDTGVINITGCKEGAPVIMSLPHFLNAAPKYINAIGGIHPEADKHETRLDVEPITGAVLHAAKRLQFNFYVKAVKSFSGPEMMNDTIFPLLWVTEGGSLNSTLANGFKQMVYLPMEMATAAQWSVLGVGVLLVIIVLVVAVIRKIRQVRNGRGLSVQDHEQLIEPDM